VSNQLREQLPPSEFKDVNISLHAYPEHYQRQLPDQPSNPTLYPDHSSRDRSRKTALMIKRVMDVAGSLLAMLVGAPLFAAIAIAIKLNSRGPVLFRQQRIGQHGRTFVLYKFRSMYDNNDANVHKQWFNEFLAGEGKTYPITATMGMAASR
jgi:lipopolysaccharide/colanic/teichoic acid biosynthesis glycosyltransferase